MALTFPRWIAAAVGGLLIIMAAVFSKDRKPVRAEDRREALIRTERRASSAASRAAARLQALKLRDSVRTAVARLRASDASRMVLSTSLPTELLRADRVLGVRLEMLRAQSRSQAIDIVFLLDTVSFIRSAPLDRSLLGVTHALPSAPGERCTSIVRHAPRKAFLDNYPRYWASYATSIAAATRILGPCGFYEAYGTPGRRIDEWLVKGAWRFGASVTLRNGYVQGGMTYEYYWFDPLWARKSGWPLRHFVSSAGYRCASGDAAVCLALVLDPSADDQAGRTAPIEPDRIVAHTNATDIYRGWWTSLGPSEPQYLADMANQVGAEQFRRFWTSDKAPAEAFVAATGQDLGAWTVAWARARYGVNERGPSPDADSAIWAVLLALGGLGAAVATSRRRQMA